MAHYSAPKQSKISQFIDVILLMALTIGVLMLPGYLGLSGAARNIVEGMQLSEYESLPDNRGFSTRLVNWNHEQDFTIGDLRRLARATNKDTQDE